MEEKTIKNVQKIRIKCEACGQPRDEKMKRIPQYPFQGAGPATACRFTIKHSREVLVGIGPTSYHPERVTSAFNNTLNKVTSTRGFSLGARLAPRFYQRSSAVVFRNHTQMVPKYHCSLKPPRKYSYNYAPFNSTTPRQPIFVPSPGPGPGSYNVTTSSNRRIPFLEHLGSGRTMIEAVRVCCAPAKSIKCKECSEPPVGDYWRSSSGSKTVLCRDCMKVEQVLLHQRARSAPQIFRKERDCSEVHCHEGTKAAVSLREERQQKRARVREAYLGLYFD